MASATIVKASLVVIANFAIKDFALVKGNYFTAKISHVRAYHHHVFIDIQGIFFDFLSSVLDVLSIPVYLVTAINCNCCDNFFCFSIRTVCVLPYHPHLVETWVSTYGEEEAGSSSRPITASSFIGAFAFAFTSSFTDIRELQQVSFIK